MDREDKILEATLDQLASKLNDVKKSIGALIFKMENEMDPVQWPSVLDSYANISSQINMVLKHLKTPGSLSGSDRDKIDLRNRILLPILVHPERDEDLVRVTENRVQAFNHEVVPNYLRTKPEPEIEEKERHLYLKASNMNPDVGNKQVTATNKIVNNILDSIRSSREEWDSSESSGGRLTHAPTFSQQDTGKIILAISTGQGLKGPLPSQLDSKSGMPGQPGGPAPPGGQNQPQQTGPTQPPAGPKAPKAIIKTNIRQHPYARNN